MASFSRRYIGEATARTAAGVGGEVPENGVGVWAAFDVELVAACEERGVDLEAG